MTKISTCVTATIMLVVGLCFLTVNVYALNKGLSLWDESYYLLSYHMAAHGFYSHFTNTPFLVAALFERFSPGLIGYRIIHLVLSILSAIVFTLSVIRFSASSGYGINRSSVWLLLSCSLFAAMYAYQLSVPTLSYNHLNEFFSLMSESLLLLALTVKDRHLRVGLLVASGALLGLDVYIKPPTFAAVIVCEFALLVLMIEDRKNRSLCMGALVAGCVLSFGASSLSFYPLSHWAPYFSLIRSQQIHSPYNVAFTFLQSTYRQTRNVAALILCGVLVSATTILWVHVKNVDGKSRQKRALVITLLLAINVYFACKLFFPTDVWHSFGPNWMYWWDYSSRTLLFVTIVNGILGLLLCWRDEWRIRKPIILLFCLLAANPVALSIGTLNGIGQVQFNCLSWILLSGLTLILSHKLASPLASTYSAFLTLLFVGVGVIYFYRQEMPFNFSGDGALYEQNYSLRDFPLLKDVYVDKSTYDLLQQTKQILDKYPDRPTLSFFDMPALQYVFGREGVVADPWLTNLEYPLTKDDGYNCKTITVDPSRLQNTIFIVSHENDFDDQLKECLATIGFPTALEWIGAIHTRVHGKDELVSLYRHR